MPKSKKPTISAEDFSEHKPIEIADMIASAQAEADALLARIKALSAAMIKKMPAGKSEIVIGDFRVTLKTTIRRTWDVDALTEMYEDVPDHEIPDYAKRVIKVDNDKFDVEYNADAAHNRPVHDLRKVSTTYHVAVAPVKRKEKPAPTKSGVAPRKKSDIEDEINF